MTMNQESASTKWRITKASLAFVIVAFVFDERSLPIHEMRSLAGAAICTPVASSEENGP